MEPVSLREARMQLGDLVRAAERGESVVLTRHGREVARLVSIHEPKKRPSLPDLNAFRESIQVKGKALSQIVIEERRRSRY